MVTRQDGEAKVYLHTHEHDDWKNISNIRYKTGVDKAVNNVNSIIAPALMKENIDIKDQSAIDAFLNKLDGTPNKTNLGANGTKYRNTLHCYILLMIFSYSWCLYGCSQGCCRRKGRTLIRTYL